MRQDLDTAKALSNYRAECSQCNSCVEACDLLAAGGLNLGEITATTFTEEDRDV
jgi:hypothetical protein